MENRKRNLLKGTLVAGVVMSTVGLSGAATSLFSYTELGSGSEIRTTLATEAIANEAGVYTMDLKCGEDSKNSKADSKSADAKCGEGKCGEATCGDKDAGKSADSSKVESKSAEAKCGEGKCGE